VLELGCGDGGNLIPMAVGRPESEFVGVDLAERPVAAGQELIGDAGLENVELRQADLENLPTDLGEFDYVISHGVYSWVPRHTRSALLAACRRHLRGEGVAYVSYNAYPGNHLRDMAREILEYHLRGAREPAERLRKAHELMQTIVDAGQQSPYAKVLRQEMERMLEYTDWLLYHDDLAAVNTPVYFHEFMEHAQAHGLQFLSEANLYESQLTNVPEAVARMLETVSEDDVVREQYLDFFHNRPFRQTLLCRAELPLERTLRGARVSELSASADAHPEASEPGRFVNRDGAGVTTDSPFFEAALCTLGEEWPAALRFTELLAVARRRVDGSEPEERDELELRELLVRGYITNFITLHSQPPPLVRRPGERPLASSLVRAQARRGRELVTNLAHEHVELNDPLGRKLVELLDGTRDRAALLAALGEAISEDPELASEAPAPEEMGQALEDSLDRLGALGLLAA
jgi:methyltransferase-like protein/ubiquinone/menaquinone biosynthesis C-methylase UbiE